MRRLFFIPRLVLPALIRDSPLVLGIALERLKQTDRTIKRYTCDMEYDIIVPTIGNDRVKQI